MDGTLGIERNREALTRILAALVAMAGLSGRTTFPRHLRNAVLRLLRPAEAATRRLIIALALAATPQAREIRNLTAQPPRPRKVDTALRQARHFMPMMPPEPPILAPLRSLALPLLDPLPRWIAPRRVRADSIPRIGVPGHTVRSFIPVRLPPSPNDALDATRLGLRLDALRRALDDLPRQALRFARWHARQRLASETGKARFRAPLRIGRPPGSKNSRPAHEVQDVLDHAHQLAWWALQHPDTS